MTDPSPTNAAPAPRTAAGRLLHLGWVLLGLLVIECIIGVGLAMYVSLPSSPSFMTVFASIPLLTAHILLAFLLVLVAAYAAMLAYRLRAPGIAAGEAIATVFLLVAVQEGFAFAFNQNNLYVLGMVLGFLGALVVQVVVIARLVRRKREPVDAPAPAPTASAQPEL